MMQKIFFVQNQCGLIPFYFEFNVLSIYDKKKLHVQKNKDELENFETAQYK